MEAAIFGLFGVIIWRVITASSNYLLERKRERAISQRESRNQAIEIRRAARLIDAELLRARAAASIAIKKKHWWIPDAKLKTEAWEKYGSVMAPVLSYGGWLAVVRAVLAIDDLSLDRLPGDIPDSTVELVPMLQDIEAGLNALAPFVFDVPPLQTESSGPPSLGQ
jgi:hypothetical protein